MSPLSLNTWLPKFSNWQVTPQRTSRSSVSRPATCSLRSVVMKSWTPWSVPPSPLVVSCPVSTVHCYSRLSRRRKARATLKTRQIPHEYGVWFDDKWKEEKERKIALGFLCYARCFTGIWGSSSLASRCWPFFLSEGSKWRASLMPWFDMADESGAVFPDVFVFILFLLYSWRYSFGPCFFSCLFFYSPVVTWLPPFLSCLHSYTSSPKVDIAGRCNGNGKIKGGIISVVGNAFRCFYPSNWLDGVLAFFVFVLFCLLYYILYW